MKTYAFLAVAVLTIACLSSASLAQNTVYWDINGMEPGAGQVDGFTDGIWGFDNFWSPDPDGEAATSAWVPGDHAVFSAGSDAVDHFININTTGSDTLAGTQVAGSLLIEDGLVTLNSGVVDTPLTTVGDGATLSVNSILRFGTTPGKITLQGGTYQNTNFGHAGSFVRNSQTLEIDGVGIVDYNDTVPGTPEDCGCTIYTPLNGNAITGVGGTPENGGAGTLIKTGAGEVRYQGPGLPLTSYAKLVVEEGLFRLGFNADTQDERGFGAVPLAVLPDAITLNGGSIAHSLDPLTLHANRGITIGPNGGASAGGGTTVPGPLSGTGVFSITGGAIVLTNTGNSATFTGKHNVSNGTLAVNADTTFGAAPGSPVADYITLGAATPTTGTLRLDDPMTIDANRGITLAGPGRINIPTGGDTVDYDGVITGPGMFTKMGDGMLRLGSAQTYDGGTDIYGRLIVNNTSGSGTGTGAVTVKTAGENIGTNGTLGGTGSVAGLVTVEAMGAIAPGDEGIGTLTLAGGLTLGADSILNLELGSPTTGDLIDVTGGVTTLDGGTVNIADVGGLGDGTYTLIDYTGTLGGSVANLALGTTPAGFTFGLVDSGSTIDLMVSGGAVLIGDHNNDGFVNAADYVFWRDQMSDDIQGYNDWRANFGDSAGSGSVAGAAVPEPASLALAGLALAGLLGLRRMR